MKNTPAAQMQIMQELLETVYRDKKFQKEYEERFLNHLLYGRLETDLEIKYGKGVIEKLIKTKIWKIIDE